MHTGRPFSNADATKSEKLGTSWKPFIHWLSVANEFFAGKPRACCILLTLLRDEQNEREEVASGRTSQERSIWRVSFRESIAMENMEPVVGFGPPRNAKKLGRPSTTGASIGLPFVVALSDCPDERVSR